MKIIHALKYYLVVGDSQLSKDTNSLSKKIVTIIFKMICIIDLYFCDDLDSKRLHFFWGQPLFGGWEANNGVSVA